MEIKMVCHFYLNNGGEQVINMTDEAYSAMKKNLEGSLRDIAHDLCANKFSYYVN